MKKFVTISALIAPLLAGCAGGSIGDRHAEDALTVQAREIASVRSQVRTLKRRIGSLRRMVAAGPGQTPQSSRVARDPNALQDLARRLSDVEATLSEKDAAPTDTDVTASVATLNAQLSELSLRFQQLKEQQSRDIARQAQPNQDALVKRIAGLEARLAELSAASDTESPTTKNSSAALKTLQARLTKLEGINKATNGTVERINGELEKDRVLVIDFLEDLDKRITELEKSAPNSPAPSNPPPPAAKP